MYIWQMNFIIFQVVLIEPCYEPYIELARLAGASVKYVPLIPVGDLRSMQNSNAFKQKT